MLSAQVHLIQMPDIKLPWASTLRLLLGGMRVNLPVTDDNSATYTCRMTITALNNIDPSATLYVPSFWLKCCWTKHCHPQCDNNNANAAMYTSVVTVVEDNVNPLAMWRSFHWWWWWWWWLTATDPNANSAMCTSVVTVKDNVNPLQCVHTSRFSLMLLAHLPLTMMSM